MNNPLWMPEGSVRSLIALALVGALIAVVIYMIIEHTDSDVTMMLVGALISLASSIGLHYFPSRQSDSSVGLNRKSTP